MSDTDRTDTLAAEAPAAPPAQPGIQPGAQPTYAAPAPRFRDQVMNLRGVIAVALAMLVIGGLSGFVLGERTNDGDGRFGPGPAGFQGGFQGGQRVFPGGPMMRMPGQQHFDQGQTPR
jgi:hypothetical protein